jgi:hypothetical protein
MRKIALVLTALTVFAAPAHAAIVFSDNFDTENGGAGATALNYTGFANFIVDGQVDLVKSGDYGITCSGSCVDLDGSSGPGQLLSSSIFNYGANKKITLSFDLGGSQRVANGVDAFQFAFFTSSDGVLAGGFDVGSGDPFQNFSYSFISSTAGSLQFAFGTSSKDNIGPLLDNVVLDISPVPEPATWAMMIGGFALIGASMRRRKTAISFA